MNSILKKTKEFGFLPIIFLISLIAVGCFHDFVSCLFSILLSAYIIIKILKEKKLVLKLNNAFISTLIITVFYLLSVIWAIDSGMAFIGFIKYLPIVLFAIAIMQNNDAKEKIISALPFFAAVMTVISAVLMQIPIFKDSFSVVDRLSGFFQYPNTFALFLLIAELLLISKLKFKYYDYIFLFILLFGIVYSGSRTVFILAVIANILAGFITKNKLLKIGIFSTVAFVIAVIAVLTIVGNNAVIDRFTAFSFKESTFVGRLLYFYDALPIILKNPFGLGYYGYYYIQQGIQSGMYSVAFIHNDFLQLMLDIGWIPAISFIIALIKPIFSKKTSGFNRIILIVMVLHSCFDFNLQFISVFCLYLLFANIDQGKEVVIKKEIIALNFIFTALAIISVYMSIPLSLSNFGALKAANSLYPYNTQNSTFLLAQNENINSAKAEAEKLIARNPYITLCYSLRARYYYAQGDFDSLIKTKNHIFSAFPYQYPEYEEYCYMLINGIMLYEQNGDCESAEYCKRELLIVPDKLQSVNNSTSKLGKMIKDRIPTELPKDITDYINTLENIND